MFCLFCVKNPQITNKVWGGAVGTDNFVSCSAVFIGHSCWKVEKEKYIYIVKYNT